VNEDELADLLGAEADRGAYADGRPARDPAADLRGLLADPAVWAEPAPGGADALLAAIRAGSDAAAPGPPPSPAPSPGGEDDDAPVAVPAATGIDTARARRARLRPTRRWVAAGAAAAVIAVVAGMIGAGLADDDGGRPEGTEFAISGTDLAPRASAVATVNILGAGVGIGLEVEGLPPAAPGTYYEAWMSGPDGKVSAGTFHMRGGDDGVYLWSGVDPDRYPTLSVTLEDEDGDPASSGRVVLDGPVA
jgi:Anti-sigma-K factor rskA, C-terminal